jgi:hypothetical protein
MKTNNHNFWEVCETNLGPSVFDGLGREVFCKTLEEANYLCNKLNKEGERFIGSKADPIAFESFVDKTLEDYASIA